MNLPHASRHALAKVILVAACMGGGFASAAPISGALFTTDAAGNVNVNQYDNKEDVYLNGGPTNANCSAAGMDDGVYVFKVTNPSGTVDLSADDISHREFTVLGGVVLSSLDHPVVAGDCNGVRVQVAPFNDTPNNGGVYKLWVTRKDDYTLNGGFQPGSTKTDNFHVKAPSDVPELADLNVYKFYDANGNGLWEADEIPLFGWAMTVTNANSLNSTQLTQSPDGLTTWTGLDTADNPYDVTEGTAGVLWHQSASIINGAPTGTPENPVQGLNLVAGQTTEVIFGNYCTCKAGGRSRSWWLGTTGQTKINDGGTRVPEFTLLNGLSLRTLGGGDFNLNLALPQADNAAILWSYLNSGSTTNMAYVLSRNLAILQLNIEAGFVKTDNFHIAFGGTIAELLADANAALLADGNTPVGDVNRALQSELNTYVLSVNHNTVVIRAKPCPFSFIN